MQVVINVKIRLAAAQRAKAHFKHLKYIVNKEST